MIKSYDKVPFLSKFAHEFKSYLHGISGISDYLSSNWDDVDEQTKKDNIDNINKASKELASLIELVAKYKEGANRLEFDFVKRDVVKFIEEIIDDFIKIQSKTHQFNINFDTNVDSIIAHIDPIWFKQLVTNIALNAVKYSSNGNVEVTVHHNKKESNFSVSIQDDGLGIKEEELEAIFVPFKRGTNEAYKVKGSGLGLSICSEIIEAHDGNIIAFNNKGKGATIEFTIPIK